MKSVSIAVVMGFILLYFVNAALKFDLLNLEMIIHSAIRFFTGFIILGIGYFYEHKIQLKISIYLVLGLFLADDILDYFRNTTTFSIELILYGIYMLLWGSLVGYLFMRSIKLKKFGEF
jgi:hypothetical protein